MFSVHCKNIQNVISIFVYITENNFSQYFLTFSGRFLKFRGYASFYIFINYNEKARF